MIKQLPIYSLLSLTALAGTAYAECLVAASRVLFPFAAASAGGTGDRL